MKQPCYIGLDEARQVLAAMGINLTERQMQRAAEQDAHGRRKLPFFAVSAVSGAGIAELKYALGERVRFRGQKAELLHTFTRRQFSEELSHTQPPTRILLDRASIVQ